MHEVRFNIIDSEGVLDDKVSSFRKAYQLFNDHLKNNDYQAPIMLADTTGKVHVIKR